MPLPPIAQVVLDVAGGRDTVVVTEPGYPVPARGAAFAGAQVVGLPLLERSAFLPELDAVPDDVWRRAALVWVSSPNNPTGATCSLALLGRLADLAGEHGFVLASDEAYSELCFDEPPPSALQLPDWTNVVVFNTLSKHAARLLDRGVLVTPGSFLGPSGEGYVRYALVPTHDECARAAAILEDVL